MDYTKFTNDNLLLHYAELIDREYDPRSSYYGVIQEEKQVREEILKRMEDKKMNDEKLTMLLQDCSQRPEVFNRISNILYENFGSVGSVAALIVTWVVIKYYDEKPEV